MSNFASLLMSNFTYRDLTVWQKSMQLVTDVYRSTHCFPKDETFGLTSQIKRAVVSVSSNIAEGQGRDSHKEFSHHLSIAYGSLMEVETQLQIACNLGYLPAGKLQQLLTNTAEVGRLLNGLARSLRNP
jgi:four helix bundle protein